MTIDERQTHDVCVREDDKWKKYAFEISIYHLNRYLYTYVHVPCLYNVHSISRSYCIICVHVLNIKTNVIVPRDSIFDIFPTC